MYSPYRININEDEGFYYFYTSQNIEYRCYFFVSNSENNVISLELDNPVYTFNLIKHTSETVSSFDRNVGATITDILNRFFDRNPMAIIVYIADNTDDKGIKRQFSFSKWVKQFNRDPKKTLIQGSIFNTFFIGTILLNSHQEKNKIQKYLEDELTEIELNTSKLGEVIVLT